MSGGKLLPPAFNCHSSNLDMRLINIHTLEVDEFNAGVPAYGILSHLSHRWVGQETTFEQYQSPQKRAKPSFLKINDFCKLVREHRSEWRQRYHIEACYVDWVWIDTCCIDKRSSAEVSEAINSMWVYYRDSKFCVAYLIDVGRLDERPISMEGLSISERYERAVAASQWFTRGWTLQELLAPEKMLFCNNVWDVLGTKSTLLQCLSTASGISASYLTEGESELRRASVAERMSWARNRTTTHPEDMAYCLFDLSEVYMPLIYGEGDRAFLRLQEEIVRRSDDESIFAWSHTYQSPRDTRHLSGLFAPHPNRFPAANPAFPYDISKRRAFRVTHKGVEMETSLLRLKNGAHLLRLMCAVTPHNAVEWKHCMLILQMVSEGNFVRKHLTDWERLEEPYDDLLGAIESDETIVTDEETICVRDARIFEEVLDEDHTEFAGPAQVHIL